MIEYKDGPQDPTQRLKDALKYDPHMEAFEDRLKALERIIYRHGWWSGFAIASLIHGAIQLVGVLIKWLF